MKNTFTIKMIQRSLLNLSKEEDLKKQNPPLNWRGFGEAPNRATNKGIVLMMML
jgi:hypothetical protein